METQNEWWYEINREQNGPVSEQEIRELYLTGMLNKDNLVWKDGLENWIPLHTTDLVKQKRESIQGKPANIDKQPKWYNSKFNLALSLLFWPAFIYGFYRSEIISRKIKIWATSSLVLLIVMAGLITKHNEGLAYIRISKKSSPFHRTAFSACYVVVPKNNTNYCFHVAYYAPNHEMAKALKNPDLEEESYTVINPSGDQNHTFYHDVFDAVKEGIGDERYWEPLSRYYSLDNGEVYENGEKLTDYLEKNGVSNKIQ